MVQSEHNITDKIQWTHVGVLLYRGNGKAFQSAGIRLSSGFGFENRITTRFSPDLCRHTGNYSWQPCFVVTIVQHRISVLDKTACMCSQTSRDDNTESVHNRSKPAVFVRTAQGLSSNQNEVAINSKSELWRTALLGECNFQKQALHNQLYITFEWPS